MQKMWSWLGLNLGKHVGLVSVIGLLITVGLGLGISRLEFATGQDSYLNKDDEVYIDNVAYQDLFGGQAMLTLVTMDDGSEVTELFGPEQNEQWEQVADEIRDSGQVLAVVTPRHRARAHPQPRSIRVGQPGGIGRRSAAPQRDRARPLAGGSAGARPRRRSRRSSASRSSRSRSVGSTTPSTSTSCSTTTKATSARR